LALSPIAVGCGGTEQGDHLEPDDGAVEVLTVEQALASEPGVTIAVSGAIVSTGSGADVETVLASVLLESYPPQAGGAVLPIADLDLKTLVGLTSTESQTDLAPVTWSDYWVVLEGVMKDGVLEVRKTPPVAEITSGDIRVRFSPVSAPLTEGTTVWWAFDVTNTGAEPLDLIFSSGQRGEIVLSKDGVEAYRWGEGKVFTEAIEAVTLAPGELLPIVMNDTFEVTPGDYDLTAKVTASVEPEATAQDLPALTMTVAVR
jgi:hypothetical protein